MYYTGNEETAVATKPSAMGSTRIDTYILREGRGADCGYFTPLPKCQYRSILQKSFRLLHGRAR